MRPVQPSFQTEIHLDVLAEPTRIIIPDRLGIPKRLEQRVRLEHLLLDRHRHRRTLPAPLREVGHAQPRGHRLARPRLSRNQHRLPVPLDHHLGIRRLGHRVAMWRQVLQSASLERRHHPWSVQVLQRLEGVQRDQNLTRIRVNAIQVKPSPKGVQNARLVQVVALRQVVRVGLVLQKALHCWHGHSRRILRLPL